MKTVKGQIKRSALNLVSCTGLVALALLAVARTPSISATVNGTLVEFSGAQPQMVNSRVMVPVRGVFEHMDATVNWDQNERAVHATLGNDTIHIPVNSMTATLNGRQVDLDSPVTSVNGRVLVPLRFLSESLGATVEWNSGDRIVEITTANYLKTNTGLNFKLRKLQSGTVIPFMLETKLSSMNAKVGDKFTAVLSSDVGDNYQGIGKGAILSGHVDAAQKKSGNVPGVLGMAFDKLTTLDGKSYSIYGKLIGLDPKSVVNNNGNLVAKSSSKNDYQKYVGYGAGGGALFAIVTKNNIITSTLIGGALGALMGEIQKDPKQSNDVTLDAGTKFGVRLTRSFSFRVPNSGN